MVWVHFGLTKTCNDKFRIGGGKSPLSMGGFGLRFPIENIFPWLLSQRPTTHNNFNKIQPNAAFSRKTWDFNSFVFVVDLTKQTKQNKTKQENILFYMCRT